MKINIVTICTALLPSSSEKRHEGDSQLLSSVPRSCSSRRAKPTFHNTTFCHIQMMVPMAM